MIRIDEIYNNTFWPWIRDHIPGTRMFFCDPFGHSHPDNLRSFGRDDIVEKNFVFMHDQEPIQLDAHRALFQAVQDANIDIKFGNPAIKKTQADVIVSELGENLEKLESIYYWRSHYYFFHGWACLDWYRGYDRTFLFPAPADRPPATQTFMSPNRIIGGQRDHRVLFVYHLGRMKLNHNHVSAPWICPTESQSITTIANKYVNTYPDILQVLSNCHLPWLFTDEPTQQMTSCWLSNFKESIESLIYVPTETVYFGRRTHITEKTFKAIALGMPFILVASAGSLDYMRSYGFKTFGDVWDESYDQETDDLKRLELVTNMLADLDSLSPQERQQVQRHVLPAVQHNWNHFYKGGFESILWTELTGMLNDLSIRR